jgi:L-amino acid N-acyltransferase YncA
MLLRQLIEQCQAWGYHHLVARANAINTASLALYQRFGHEVVGVQREVTYVHGRWLDGVFMQCILDDVQPVTKG